MGRKGNLTEAVQDAICKSIENGNYPATSAEAAGITSKSYYEWMQKGLDNPSSKYGEFRDAVEKAKAIAEQKYLRVIEKAAILKDDENGDIVPGQWQAAAWWLERTRRSKYGRNVEDDERPTVIAPTQVNVSIDADIIKGALEAAHRAGIPIDMVLRNGRELPEAKKGGTHDDDNHNHNNTRAGS